MLCYCSQCDVQWQVDRGSMQMVFFTPLIYSPERKTQGQNHFDNHNYIILSFLFRKPLTLFAPILLHHARLFRSSSSLPMLSLPLLSTDCLSFLPLGGPGPPSPPSPQLTLFPSGPRQQSASTLYVGHSYCAHFAPI
jgi:hypothetical protein